MTDTIRHQPPSALVPPTPQYTKLPDAQIQHGGKYYITDASYWLTNSLQTVVQAFAGGIFRTATTAAAKTSLSDEYDPRTRSWAGEEPGMRYRVPLMTVPGSGHCRHKLRNVQVLMNNVRELCVTNQLPATKDEQRFWASYRFLRYQLFLVPFFCSLSVTYTAAKFAFNHLPIYLKGRMPPVLLSLLVAEQMQDAMFPAEDLLRTAMMARTPLGDAARAEWLRLQPLNIPQSAWVKYKFSLLMRDPLEGFEFGGNIVEQLK